MSVDAGYHIVHIDNEKMRQEWRHPTIYFFGVVVVVKGMMVVVVAVVGEDE
jgi:hypothetical protein